MAIASAFASRTSLTATADCGGFDVSARRRASSIDRRTLICQLSWKLPSEPVCEFTGEADQLRRSQSVAGERFPNVYLGCLDVQKFGEPGYQPCPGSLPRRARTSPSRAVRWALRHTANRHYLDFRPLLALRVVFQRPIPKSGLANTALDLAAGSLRNASRPEEHDGMDPHVMLFCDGSANSPDHCLGFPASSFALSFEGEPASGPCWH